MVLTQTYGGEAEQFLKSFFHEFNFDATIHSIYGYDLTTQTLAHACMCTHTRSYCVYESCHCQSSLSPVQWSMRLSEIPLFPFLVIIIILVFCCGINLSILDCSYQHRNLLCHLLYFKIRNQGFACDSVAEHLL